LLVLELLCAIMCIPLRAQAAQFIYVVNEFSDNISAYSIDSNTGALEEIAGSPFATARTPHYLALNPAGTFAYVVCDDAINGSLQSFAVDKTTGRLTLLVTVPLAPGSALVPRVDPSGRFLLLASGRTGNVAVYSLDSATGVGTLTNSLPLGGFAWSPPTVDPTAGYVYVAGWGNTVAALRLTTGALSTVPSSPWRVRSVPKMPIKAPTALIPVVHPSGRYLYIADPVNRAIAAFSIAADGSLTVLANSPFRAQDIVAFDMTVEPKGKYLYLSDWDRGVVAGFAIADSGMLTPLPGSPFATPLKASDQRSGGTALTIESSGSFLYMTDTQANKISGFRIDSATGALHPLLGNPLATGKHPFRFAVSP